MSWEENAAQRKNALKQASLSLGTLLGKLQEDGYLASGVKLRIANEVLTELAAFTCMIWAEYGSTLHDRLRELAQEINCLFYEPEGFAYYSRYYENVFRENAVDNMEINGFMVLERFDVMAQENSGAFYARMRVDNPGKISDLYMELFEAYIAVIALYHEKYQDSLRGNHDGIQQECYQRMKDLRTEA